MYDLGHQLAGVTVPPGTNLLVSGPPLTGKRRLALETLASGAKAGDGSIIITTRDSAERVLSDYGSLAGEGRSAPVRVVDAVTKHMGRTVEDSEEVKYTASPTDVTGIGIEFSELVESYDSRTDVGGIRVFLDSLTTLLLYSNLQTVFRFMHVFTSRVENADAIGLYTIESTAHGAETMNTLGQLFDGVLRFDADGEVTVDIEEMPTRVDP